MEQYGQRLLKNVFPGIMTNDGKFRLVFVLFWEVIYDSTKVRCSKQNTAWWFSGLMLCRA